jgi:hypothetical protein
MKMKYLLACLLMIGCLVSTAWSEEPSMTLEEFVQKLETAKPWTREKVEALLGIKFTETLQSGSTSHKVFGQFEYVKGLFINKISLEISADPEDIGEPLTLRLDVDDKSSCFTQKQIKKYYPGVETSFPQMDLPYVQSEAPVQYFKEYFKEQSWGELVFELYDKAYGEKGGCLSSIGIITNIWIEKQKKFLQPVRPSRRN